MFQQHRDENSKQIVEKIKTTAQNMDNMLHKIHHLYQIDKITKWEELDLTLSISGLIKEFETTLDVNNIVVELNIKQEIIIYTIPELINIALRCILENSTFYLNAFNEQHKISIDLFIKGDQCVIKFQDNGIGIKEDELENVFDAYVRKNAKSVGSGLGLHIAKKAIERVRGHIELQSSYGKGTSVLINLPLKNRNTKMISL
jgi:signal transduction histidine kinase